MSLQDPTLGKVDAQDSPLISLDPGASADTKRALCQEDRDRILDSLIEGITSGETPRELSARRQHLAKAMGCSPAQVNSVGAWITIRSNKALHAAGLAGAIRTPDFVTACKVFRLCQTPDEQKLQLSELAREFSADPEALLKAVESFNAARAIAAGTASGDSPPLLPHQSPASSQESLDRAAASDAALANYDNPEKIAWRNAWFKFLKDNFPASFFETARVICLPSFKCEREIRGYLDLGVPPGNILAIENDPGVREEFERNANRLGVRHHFGNVQDYLKSSSERFSIVSLDYPGPLCPAYISALSNILLPGISAVLVNVMAAREQKPVQDSLAAMHSLAAPEFSSILGNTTVDLVSELTSEEIHHDLLRGDKSAMLRHCSRAAELFRKRVSEAPPTEAPALTSTRASSLSRLLVLSLSASRDENTPFHIKYSKAWEKLFEGRSVIVPGPDGEPQELGWGQISDYQKYRYASSTCTLFGIQLAAALARRALPARWRQISASDIAAFTRFLLLGNQIPLRSTEYSYNSGASQARTPYHSIFAAVYNPAFDIDSSWSAARFAAVGVFPLMLNRSAILGVTIRSAHSTLRPGEGLRADQTLVLHDRSIGRTLSRVKIGDFLDAVSQFSQFLEESRSSGLYDPE